MRSRITGFLIAAVAIIAFALPTSAGAQVQPDSMLYEIVQTDPDIGAFPPTAEAGFGSTNGGALGTINIQKYIRTGGNSGNSILGSWLSAGANVAPLLAGAPFNVDSIYAEFRDDNTYTVRQVDKSGTAIILEGTYAAAASGVGNINTITVNQSTPTTLTAKGIFEIFTPPPPDSMFYEIVQTDPDIGAVPPTAEAGFGSTNGGALGTINIQKYIRTGGNSGSSIVGSWLSAGANVAPLLTGAPFNVDSIYAEFRDDNTYTVRQVDKSGTAIILEGTYAATPSGVGNINTITVNQSTPTTLTAKGIFEIFVTITGIDDAEPVPSSFALQQNYPNPFNPSTQISFSLPQNANVTLKVFNAIGQEVATLVNRPLPAGAHTIVFDASSLPSGVYLYRLQAGSQVSVKKMILVR